MKVVAIHNGHHNTDMDTNKHNLLVDVVYIDHHSYTLLHYRDSSELDQVDVKFK